MKNRISLAATFVFAGLTLSQISAQQSNVRLAKANTISYSKHTDLPNFIDLSGQTIKEENFVNWAVYSLNLPTTSTFKPYSVEKDELGFTHTRHQQFINDVPVEGTMIITHSKNNELKSVNGDYYQNFNANLAPSINEERRTVFFKGRAAPIFIRKQN